MILWKPSQNTHGRGGGGGGGWQQGLGGGGGWQQTGVGYGFMKPHFFLCFLNLNPSPSWGLMVTTRRRMINRRQKLCKRDFMFAKVVNDSCVSFTSWCQSTCTTSFYTRGRRKFFLWKYSKGNQLRKEEWHIQLCVVGKFLQPITCKTGCKTRLSCVGIALSKWIFLWIFYSTVTRLVQHLSHR